MNNSGQGAIEYLLILGAAILVVATVIVAISSILNNVSTPTATNVLNPLQEQLTHTRTSYLIEVEAGDYSYLAGTAVDGASKCSFTEPGIGPGDYSYCSWPLIAPTAPGPYDNLITQAGGCNSLTNRAIITITDLVDSSSTTRELDLTNVNYLWWAPEKTRTLSFEYPSTAGHTYELKVSLEDCCIGIWDNGVGGYYYKCPEGAAPYNRDDAIYAFDKNVKVKQVKITLLDGTILIKQPDPSTVACFAGDCPIDMFAAQINFS